MKTPLFYLDIDWKLPNPIRGFKGSKRDFALKYLGRRLPNYKRDLNKFSMLFKKFKIDLQNKTVLDIAAGPGVDIAILSTFKPKKLLYLDKYKESGEVAKEFLQEKLKGNIYNIKFIIADIMDISKIKSIDFITCRDSIFLAGNDLLFFKNIKNSLNNGCCFWFSCLDFRHYKENIDPDYDIKNKILNRIVYFIYLITGLMLRAMVATSIERIKEICNRLNFNVLQCETKGDGYFEFLIQKPAL